MSATLRWSSPRDELRVAFPGAHKGEAALVRVRPDSVRVSAPGKPDRMWPLSAAPLLPRRMEMDVPHAGRPVLRIEGLDHPVTLPSRKLPASLEFTKELKLEGFSARTGPRPSPPAAGER
jgi:hypothetical protein